MNSKVKFTQSRDTILQAAGLLASPGRRRPSSSRITEQDYAAVPPPLNLMVQPVGNCIIWLWNINNGGYGTGSFSDEGQLAHRQAFRQSRGRPAGRDVLHLCHRPFCIQPSHLYDGSAKDNSEDRKIRISGGVDFDLLGKKSEIVQSVARYQWASPKTPANQALILAPIEHDCDFIIPAMDGKLCPTCGRDALFDDGADYLQGADQPDNTDRNVARIAKRSRSIASLPEGLSISTTGTVEYSVPTVRAERRRRQREERKARREARPVHLGSRQVAIRPGESANFNLDLRNAPIKGPGVLLIGMTPFQAKNHSQGGDAKSS